MPATLQITDGTDTIDFTGSNYKLLHDGGWSPKRAQRRVSPLGGRSIYEDVEERMSIQVSGSSATDTWSKYDDLSNLLDQAERWGNGENVDAVLIKYSPSGSSTDVQAVIVGPPSGGSFMQPPSDADKTANTNPYIIGHSSNPIVLSFVRRGLWLSTASESKSASASTGNPDIVTAATFTTGASIPSPIDITLDFDSTGAAYFADMFIVTADNTNKMAILEGEDGIGASGTSATMFGVSPSGASGGRVAIIDEAGMDAGYEQILTYSTAQFDSFSSTSRQFAIYAGVRQRDAAYTFLLKAEFLNRAKVIDADVAAASRMVTIDAADTFTHIKPLGLVSLPDSISKYGLDLHASGVSVSTTSTAKSIEIDYLIIHATDDPSINVVNVKGLHETAGTSILKTYIKHRLDSHLEPDLYADGMANERIDFPREGNADTMAINSTVGCLLFGVARLGAGSLNFFITEEGATTTAANFTLTADRTLGFLTPQ